MSSELALRQRNQRDGTIATWQVRRNDQPSDRPPCQLIVIGTYYEDKLELKGPSDGYRARELSETFRC